MWRFFDSVGAEKVIDTRRASFVTALPSNPSDGDEVIFTDSLTAPTYQWHLRYVSAKSSNKWLFIGGAPVRTAASGSISTSSSSFVDLTSGPTLTVPLAGSYRAFLTVLANLGNTGTNSQLAAQLLASTSGGSTVLAQWTIAQIQAGAWISAQETRSLVAAETLKVQVKSGSSVDATFQSAYFSLEPIAVGG